MPPSCGSWSLWLAAIRVVRRWSRVPSWVFDVPQHLRAYAGRYSDPEMWPTLYGLQHDEKDVFRVVGRAGLQDWGDGDAQTRLAALDAAAGALAAAVAALRSLAPDASLDQASYLDARRMVQQQLQLLQEYAAAAVSSVAALDAKAAKLRSKLSKLTAGEAKQIERLNKYLAFISARSAEVSSFTTHRSAGEALPPAPAAAHTAASLTTMLGDHRALLETGFGLANPPASKALATCLCSVFDCSPWTTGALFFTVDDAKTWQVREAVYRAMLDAVDEGRRWCITSGG